VISYTNHLQPKTVRLQVLTDLVRPNLEPPCYLVNISTSFQNKVSKILLHHNIYNSISMRAFANYHNEDFEGFHVLRLLNGFLATTFSLSLCTNAVEVSNFELPFSKTCFLCVFASDFKFITSALRA